MPGQRREQVFVSSTFMDLIEERQEVIQTLLEAGCIPAGMELFPASDEEKWALIKRVIDECDYYVLVIGGRYGSLDPEKGISYTEMEYDYAVEQGKPVMAFLHGSPGNITAAKSEMGAESQEKLRVFREKAEQKMVKFWTNAGELGGQVAKSLISLRQTRPAEGWIRAEYAMTSETESELAQLRARVAQLTVELERATSQAEVTADAERAYFAQGDDVITVEVTVRYLRDDRYEGLTHYDLEITWDTLFGAVAPSLVDEANESELSRALDATCSDKLLGDPELVLPEDFQSLRRLSAPSDLLDQVKVQFLALNLIKKSEKRHTASDKNSYWTLTRSGHTHMLAIRAIRRPSGSDASPDSV